MMPPAVHGLLGSDYQHDCWRIFLLLICTFFYKRPYEACCDGRIRAGRTEEVKGNVVILWSLSNHQHCDLWNLGHVQPPQVPQQRWWWRKTTKIHLSEKDWRTELVQWTKPAFELQSCLIYILCCVSHESIQAQFGLDCVLESSYSQ